MDFHFGGGLRCDTSLRSFYGGWLGGLLSLRSGMSDGIVWVGNQSPILLWKAFGIFSMGIMENWSR